MKFKKVTCLAPRGVCNKILAWWPHIMLKQYEYVALNIFHAAVELNETYCDQRKIITDHYTDYTQ